jgi:hypothetical protein
MWTIAETNGVGVILTSRYGGVSKPPFHTFNLAYHVGDNHADVHKNRMMLARSMDLSLSQLHFMEQVHGNEVVEIFPGITSPTCDALITNQRQLALLVMTADCVPILFYDPQNHAIGVAHAGWKGTVGQIAARTLQKMKYCYGTNPEDLHIYFGPTIHACCYEIGETVKHAVISNFPTAERYFIHKGDRTYFDLILCNKEVLIENGVNPDNMVQNPACVSCQSDNYFSYRANGGITGRQVTGLWIKG